MPQIQIHHVEEALKRLQEGRFTLDWSEEEYHDYLYASGYEYLAEKEQDLLDFMLTGLLTSMSLAGLSIDLDPDALEKQSTEAWVRYEVDFKNKLPAYIDFCFEQSDEEELLAFLEDCLDQETSQEENALLWIAGMTLVDHVC